MNKREKDVGYYGTRVALGTAVVADIAAVRLIGIDLVGISNLGDWQFGWRGGELTFKNPASPFSGPDFRLNPFGDWKNPDPYARPPHWHQRPGIGRHLPWEWWF